MRYRSTYLDSSGKTASTVIEAQDEQELHEFLHSDGRLLLRAVPSGRSAQANRGVRIPKKKLLLFTQSMESSLDAGVPVLAALESCRDQETDVQHGQVFASLTDSLRQGSTFAQALAQFPRIFSATYTAMVQAGESSGKLVRSFATLGGFLEWSIELGKTIRQAMVYPIIVLTAGYALILFLLGVVLPGLNEVIGKLGAEKLSTASRYLITVSGFVSGHMAEVIGVSLALGISLALTARSAGGRRLAASVVAKLPVARGVVANLNLAQLCRGMSALLASGLTVIQAMELGRDTLSLHSLRKRIEQARQSILSGQRVHEAWSQEEILPPVALGMLKVGEESGDLPRCFDRLAVLYDREAKSAVKSALAMMEPLVTIMLGLIVGGVAAIIIMTLYTSIGGLGK